MNQVLSFSRRQPPVLAHDREQQIFHLAAAELSGAWCTVRAVRLSEDVWLGLAPAGGAFVEGLRLRGSLVAMLEVAGRHALAEGSARVLDRPQEALGIPAPTVERAVRALSADASARTVAVLFRVERVREDAPEDSEGAVPRT